MKKTILTSVALVLCLGVTAQKKEKVLFKIDGEPTYVSEFQELFKPDQVSINSTGFDDNLELMVNYKLKLRLAKKEGIDTLLSVKKELKSYKEDLAAPFLTDDATLENLLQEAYDRTRERVKASHILVMTKGTDTMPAYRKIKDLQNQLKEGADFGVLAKKYSEDKGSAIKKGELGYFTAFKMVYPFESGAYNTAVGQVSEIVKTQFGYHLIKVDGKEPVEGKIKAAHIMVAGFGDAKKQKIDSVYQKLQKGEGFEELAKKYSDDRRSSGKGGDLIPFSKGDLPKSFEDVVFSMKDKDSYSAPFKTAYGWHIVKYKGIEAVKPLSEMKEALKRKVLSGARGKKPIEVAYKKIESKYDVVVFEDAKEIFKNKRVYKYPKDSLQQVLLSINDKDYFQKDFLKYVKNKNRKSALTFFDAFKKEKLRVYMIEHLEDENEKYRKTINDYRNGLIIFELMENHVWGRPKNEPEKVEDFYNKNIEKYNKKGTAFKDVKGFVESDYQDYLEQEWMKELRENSIIKYKKRAVKKVKKTYE